MDLMKMMKNAKGLQETMQKLQSEMETMAIEGNAGGGMVKITLNGKGEMKGLQLDRDLLRSCEPDMLEDLMIAAHQDARAKMESVVAEKGQSMLGGMGLSKDITLPS